MATYAIGDIHGRPGLLARLLAQVSPEADDTVVFLGDYIDRGPDSKGVVDVLTNYKKQCPANVRFLLGNHEQWFLQTRYKPRKYSWLLGMNGLSTVRSYSHLVSDELEACLKAAVQTPGISRPELPYARFFDLLPQTHLDFFGSLELMVETQDVCAVHAGLAIENGRIADQFEADIVWSKAAWWRDYTGSRKIVYGHWNNADPDIPSPHISNNTYGIDCEARGALMAIRFPDERIWCVKGAA